MDASSPNPSTPARPALHFILGPPCAGKSTLAKRLTTAIPSLQHVSVGALLRALATSSDPSNEDEDENGHVTGPVPRTASEEYTMSGALSVSPSNSLGEIRDSKAEFGQTEGTLKLPTIDIETKNRVREAVEEHKLLDGQMMASILHEALFPSTSNPSAQHILIDGFPRSGPQYPPFLHRVSSLWTPLPSTVVIVLNVSKEEARRRFEGRARVNDEFEERFDEYQRTIGEIVKMFEKQGVRIVQVGEEENIDMEEMVQVVCKMLIEVGGWEV